MTLNQLLADGGLLCILLLLAVKCGLALSQWRARAGNGLADHSTGLYNTSGFSTRGDALLEQCQRADRPLAVAVFDCADLVEVRSIYGTQVARKLMKRVVRQLKELAAQGLAARTGPTEFTVILPGFGHAKALGEIARVLGRPTSFEMDAGDHEIVLVPDCLVEAAGSDIASVNELLVELRRELALRKAHERRRHHHMRRERERHSRPMGLPVAAN